MGLKKRSKVSAEFSMSSLTDIIFLLLIFFMLTSSAIAPNSINLRIPSSKSDRVTSTRKLDKVTVSKSGSYRFNGSRVSVGELERKLLSVSNTGGQKSFTLSHESGTPVEAVVEVMDIALRLNLNAVLAVDK